MWRDDVLAVAWQAVRRNDGAAGVDGETVADVESFGVDRWLEALARDLKAGTYRPQPVRQVLIPKKQRGKFRPLGIPCLRDRVAQTAAMLARIMREGAVEGETQEPPCGTNVVYTTF